MTQGISDFIRAASTLPDATPLRVEQDTVTQATYKHGVTRAENMQSNTETARAFLNAVRSHPGYARGGEAVAAQLSHKIEKGLPLCADEVRTMARQLNAGQIRLMGERLENVGILPRGTAADFTRHTLSTFGSLEGEHALRASVRDFLVRHFIPASAETLTTIDSALVGHNGPPLSADEKKQIQEALVAYHGATDAESCLKKLLIKNIADGLLPNAPAHPEFGKGMAGLAETGIVNLFAETSREAICLLAALPAQTRDTVLKDPDLLRTLVDNQHRLSPDERIEFVRFASVNQLSLTNRAEQATVMLDFLLIQSGKRMNQPLPGNLPAALSYPIAVNPEVKRNAIAKLQADMPPGGTPSGKQVDDALFAACNEFATAHAPVLNEFVQMAMEPPAGLNIDPPLTPQTLPHYLNTLLSGDAILEPLFNDSRPVDADFLQSALLYNRGIESTGDVDGIIMGIDDSNNLHEGAMKLLMARRGVEEKDYPAVMERGIARFGHVLSELNTLSGECFNQANLSAQREVLGLRRVLSGTLVNMAQLLTPANRAALSLPADPSAAMDALLNPLDVSVSANEFSTQMHEFGTSLEIQLPPPNNAVAMSAMEKQLLEANCKIADSTLVRILGDAKQLRERTTSFTELAHDVAVEQGLDKLNTGLLEPKLFFGNARKLLHEKAAEATSQNATLDEGVLRSALRQSLATDMKGMSSRVAEIEGLSNPPHLPEEQHKAQKLIMKEMVHRYPAVDVAVLSQFMNKAAGESAAMDKLRAPQGTPFAVTTAVSVLASAFADLAKAVGANAMPPQHVALPCFLDMVLRAGNLSANEANIVQQNITGEAGKSVGGAYKFVMESADYTSVQRSKAQLAHSMLTHLATLSTILVKGKAEHEPLRFAAAIGHISEMPGGTLSMISPTYTLLQNALNLRGTRFSRAQWELLENTFNGLGPARNQQRLAEILASNAPAIIAGAEARRNSTILSMNQVAIAVMGSRLTPEEDANGTTDGERLCNAFVSRFTKEAHDNNREVSAGSIEKALRMGLANGFSFPVLKELTHPAGRLTQDKVPAGSLELGSLGNYTAGNAYGLLEDFPRLGAGSITIMKSKEDKPKYSPSVFLNEDKELSAEHQVFKSIIKDVRALAPSEAQMLRIMHILSQAGRKCAGMSGQAFPSTIVRSGSVPPMTYSIMPSTKDRVEVTMKSLQSDPLAIEQTFLVNNDGSYTVTNFDIHRRALDNMQPAQPAQA